MDCSCDYDPAAFYLCSIRKARKQHRCDECAGTVMPGEKYEHATGKWDSGVYTFKTCERCVDLRTWVQNNVPCLCWSHGSGDEALRDAVDEARHRAPLETVGIKFGLLRRLAARDKLNASRSAE